MLKVNDSIRNAYKQKTTQRKSYIKVGDNSFFIQNLDVSADAYDEGNVIGNAIAKIAKFDIETEYVKGLDEFELFDGIWTGEKYEYVSLGTFKLFEEQGTDEFFSSITSYDKLVLFNKPYDNTNVNFPISLYDFLKEICSQANVELETKRIANGDKILFQNLFVEGETLKQILKAICQISGNFAKIKNDKLVIGLYDYDSYIATGNEIVLEDVVEEKTKIKQYGYTKQDGTPTPDAPIEIEVATGSVSVKSNGKNLCSSVKLNGTYGFYLYFNASELSKIMTISLKASVSKTLHIYLLANGNSGSLGTINLVSGKRVSKTITLTDEQYETAKKATGLAYFSLYKGDAGIDATATIDEPQIEKGDVATEYQEYQESSITYNLGDNFLADKDYTKDSVLNKNVGKVVLNGSENWYKYNGDDAFGHTYYTYFDKAKRTFNSSVCSHFTNVQRAWVNTIGKVGYYSDFTASDYKYFCTDKATVDEWKAWLKENPVTVYYELTTPEQIQLETTGELRTFEPYTIITNDLDSEMEVEYGKYIEIDKDELYQPEYKRTTWKLNKVVLGMKDVEGEFVSKQDDEDIEKNGTHQLVINDNPFVYTQQLREEYIGELFERIKGFGYVAFESGFEGVPYYELGDLIKIEDKKSIILRYNLQSPKGLESTFSAPSIIDSVVEYTQTPNILEQKMRSTELRVDKAEGNIIGITKQTTEIRDNLNKNYYTIEQANTLIQNAETGVTNTFSEAGGNNVFRNTGLWFANSGEDAETNPYEFWIGKANEGNNNKATNYRSILLGKGSFIQDAEVPNGNYSISFYYRKLISNAVASVVMNDKEYELNSTNVKQFYTGEQNIETGEYIVDPIVVTNNHIKIEFKCDALDGVEVYDLMCNKGSVKLAYSQNQNETTTNTVNISKGITITSSADENTKFKADYDGIRVLDKSGNIKTKFTDKGTETDELLVRKKATITGLLHQEVDDQTWATKI